MTPAAPDMAGIMVYLAGPQVFLPDAAAVFAKRRAACATHGLLAVTPFDVLPDEPTAWAALPEASRIARRNQAHIRRCHAVIADLTPFRGVSADVGTAYEVGYARALGRPVFAFSADPAPYEARVLAWAGLDGGDRDGQGMEIERFGLADNLMVACGVEPDGMLLVPAPRDAAAQAGADAVEELFARCAAAAAGLSPAPSTAEPQGG